MVKANGIRTEVDIGNTRISDHAIVNIKLYFILGSRLCRVMGESSGGEKVDEQKFMKIFRSLNWEWVREIEQNENKNINSVNEKFDKLYRMLETVQQQAKQKISVKHNKKVRQPWMTAALMTIVQQKSKAYEMYRKDKENIVLRDEFRKQSAHAKRELRKAQRKYYSELLRQNAKSPKKYWEIVNELRGCNKRNMLTEIKIEGEKILAIENPVKIAQSFNKYFNQVPSKLVEKLIKNKDSENEKIEETQHETENVTQGSGQKLSIFTLTEGDVEQSIHKLNNKKSTGLLIIS